MRPTWCAPPPTWPSWCVTRPALKLLDVLPRETGTIGLGWGITGMRVVFSTKEINGATDIKGMKLRINPTPVYRDFYQMLGAAPTPIPTPAGV
jgi:TRAP-type C4-dicarboxylate transport system substrate-binding protein